MRALLALALLTLAAPLAVADDADFFGPLVAGWNSLADDLQQTPDQLQQSALGFEELGAGLAAWGPENLEGAWENLAPQVFGPLPPL